MKLTLDQFFERFPMIKQVPFAYKIGVKKEAFTAIKHGATMTENELKEINKYVSDLANNLAQVVIVHKRIHTDGARRKRKK